jgi:hypothetical protein
MLCSELAASHSLQSGICVHHLNVACMKDFVQIPAMQFFAARLNLRVEKILVDHTRELAEYDCTQRRLNTIIARQYGGDAMMLYDWVMLSSDCVQELEEYKKDVAAWRCSCSLYRNASESQMIRAALVTLRADLRILRSVRFLDKYQSKPHYLDNGDGYDSSERFIGGELQQVSPFSPLVLARVVGAVSYAHRFGSLVSQYAKRTLRLVATLVGTRIPSGAF